MSMRRSCPSCQARLHALALECPVCGLALPHAAPPRPLLFQASALTGRPPENTPSVAIATPALGRIAPIPMEASAYAETSQPQRFALEDPPSAAVETPPSSNASFLLLAKVEALEALLLACLNGFLLLVVWISAQAPLDRVYGSLWHLLLVLHLAISWMVFLVPITLTGQSPLMGRHGLLLDTDQPERRLSFSLFHFLAVVLFPLSFLCMVLTSGHRTLAELLTGQELLLKSQSR